MTAFTWKKKKQGEFSKAQEPHTLWSTSQAQLPVFWLLYPQFQSSPSLSWRCHLWDMQWPHTHGDNNDCWCEGHSFPRTRLSRVCFHHPSIYTALGISSWRHSRGWQPWISLRAHPHRSSDVALIQHQLTHTSKPPHIIFESQDWCSLFPLEAKKSPTATVLTPLRKMMPISFYPTWTWSYCQVVCQNYNLIWKATW